MTSTDKTVPERDKKTGNVDADKKKISKKLADAVKSRHGEKLKHMDKTVLK